MCLKLDNGTELFTTRDMEQLRGPSSGRMGGTSWVAPAGPTTVMPAHAGCADRACRCQGRCVRCACLERRAAQDGDEVRS